MMLEALLSDLLAVPGIEVITTRDARLPPLSLPVQALPVSLKDDVWQRWEECIANADAVWPIAPETGGVLERLSRLVRTQGKMLLNSAPEAVMVTASKVATAQMLVVAGIAAVPTYVAAAWVGSSSGPWVVKPDDGVGCEDTCLLSDAGEVQRWLNYNNRKDTHVVQPYLPGDAASLSVLCRDGRALLLSCNRQSIELQQGMFRYRGTVLNGAVQHWDRCEKIAQAVVLAIPGLAGYVGMDVLIRDGEIIVVEVNPRLTTSYAGLARALGCNPARLVLDLHYNEHFSWMQMFARHVVEINLDE